MSYFPEPPYFLLVAGILVALTSGAAFAATLKQIVQKWASDRAANRLSKLPTAQLILPFLGISAGVGLFLSSGLEVFGFPNWLSYAVAIPLTLLIGLLIWLQLGSMLSLVEREGFQSIDIDSWR
ncbi:hypothetical protein [Chroococcidiopsis sp. CCMEE 29]|uniref:hypothetical protein n=1 Tax=Chroococcidiopsis sp. CCMEE 29 TaxID=155894 RepID=UPI00201FD59F|nr:hypothetical protein [Chroococcidiopsis sp. CCMEE 29]